MSGPAVAVAFFDPAQQLYGTARAGATVLFEGRTPTAIAEGPLVERDGERLRASLAGRMALELEPVSEPLDLDGVAARVCRVAGEVEGRRVACLGTVSETRETPSWDELDLLRSLSILVDERHAFVALARRPRGAVGHGQERVAAWLVRDGEALPVEDARISTVYDDGGRQRNAGLELWMKGEEFPRRGSGAAVAGSSLELEALSVHAAIFRWRLEGQDGFGAYELMVRREPPAAA